MNLLNARTFQSLEHLNDCTRRWLAEVADVRVHRQTDRRPIDLHAEDLPHLIPLPSNPDDVAEVVYRSLDAEGFVTFRQNQYSVPWRWVGQVVPLRVREEELIVYGLALEELARHRLLPSGVTRQRQVTAEHRPPDPGGALPRQRHAGELRLDVQRRHDRPRLVRGTGHGRVRPPR